MTPTEARLRNTTFWGVFVVDRMWAIYLGRPFQSCLEDITVERPLSGGFQSSTATSFWEPYGTPGDNQIQLPDIQGLLTDRWVALFEIMSELGHSRKSILRLFIHVRSIRTERSLLTKSQAHLVHYNLLSN